MINEDFIKKMVSDSIPEIRETSINNWAKLSVYLDKERRENNATEFRIVVNADDSFYVHPLGQDGNTLDGNLFK
jgi:hypothetical protein